MLGVMGVAAGDEAMDASLGPVVWAEGSDEAELGSVAGAWSMDSLPGVSGHDLRSRDSTIVSWSMVSFSSREEHGMLETDGGAELGSVESA